MTHLWEIDHPSYASDRAYTARGDDPRSGPWKFSSWTNWTNFIKDNPTDEGYSNELLVLRWDWKEEGFNDDNYYRNGKLELFFLRQKKGHYFSIIVDVCRADEEAVRMWLKDRLNDLLRVWEPIA